MDGEYTLDYYFPSENQAVESSAQLDSVVVSVRSYGSHHISGYDDDEESTLNGANLLKSPIQLVDIKILF